MSALSFLYSCSSLPVATSVKPVGWESSVQQKNKIKKWEIRGRLAIQTEDEGGTLDLFWKQDEDDYDIRLVAPLGQGAYYVRGNTESVSIRTNKGVSQTSSNPEALFEQQLGVDFPVMNLQNWLLGLPAKQDTVETALWDDRGQLFQIIQSRWKIEMADYQSVGQYMLPHSLRLQHQDRAELLMRLLIMQWTLSPDISSAR